MAVKQTTTPKVGWAMAAELTREYMKLKYNILFTGQPGIGKTALIKLVTEQLNYDLIIFHPCISDPTDFKGMPWVFQDKDGKQHCVFVPFDQLEQLINATRPTVCFMDDLIQAPEAVQAAAMQLLHGGTLNGKRISKHVRFVACTNRKQDRAGGTSILEPVKSRFHGIFELVPEIEPFVQYLIKTKASPILVAFMRNRPEWIYGGDGGWKPAADIVNQPCPRTIDHLSDVVNIGLNKVVATSAYAGAVGEGMANEYFQFEQMALRLPDVDVILQNPLGAPAPASDEIAYAMIGALHSRMTRGNMDNIYTYIRKNFTLELQAVFHWDVESYNESLMKTKGYVNWSKDHGEILSN